MSEQRQMLESYHLSDNQFRNISKLIYSSAGIHLGDHKKELVHARLSKVLRMRKIKDFNEYIHIINNDTTGDELIGLLDAISTNVTHFFRETKHFEFLIRHITDRGEKGNLQIWSAGCSSGEEPYSIAITLLDHILRPGSPKPYILATDISTKVLHNAVKGIYPFKLVENIDKSIVKKYFLKGKNNLNGLVKIKKEVADLVSFERMNLIDAIPFKKKFDVIFCRNVMIYFDTTTRQNIIEKFYDALVPGGYFIIGHSESLSNLKHKFHYMQPTVHRK